MSLSPEYQKAYDLAKVIDKSTGTWKYGRRTLQQECPRISEWAIRKLLVEIRGNGRAVERPPTPMQKVKKQKEISLLGTQIVIKVPKLEIPKRKTGVNEQWIIASDFHAPWHHPQSCSILYQVVRDVQPNKIILLGDVINLDPFSKYDKEPNGPTWIEDISVAAKIIGSLYQASPSSKIEWRKGNHEERLEKYLMRHDPLFYEYLDIEKLFIISGKDEAIKSLDLFTYQDINEEFIEDLRLVLKHGDKIRKAAGNSVRAEVENLWMSVIIGHSHRLGIVSRSSGRSRYLNEQPSFGIEAGCMCRYDIPYINENTTDWQHGFVALSIDRNSNPPIIEPSVISISDGKAVFRGKVYQA